MHRWKNPRNWPALMLGTVLLVGVEVSLRIFRFQALVRYIQILHDSYPFLFVRERFARLVRDITDSIPRVDRHLGIFSSSCLRQSLALKLLYGSEVPLFIGVRRLKEGGIAAHAWTAVSDPTQEPEVGFQELGVF